MQKDWVARLKEWGVLREGHFLLTSGRHSPGFLLFAPAFSQPAAAEELGQALAAVFKGKGIETVVGPAMGGVILAHEVARALGVRSIYSEKDGDAMALRRGFSLRPGERVLVVEDAVSTGGSVQKVLDICEKAQADVVGVGVIADRTAGKVKLGVPLQALLELEVPSYTADDCPLCRAGEELTRPKA
ncbi:MAG: orotate phosphoribosyltransferase [Thermaerobacter sp.]|nr:orotate phosphoribosyltransferase [Thermaerobacter sp.]